MSENEATKTAFSDHSASFDDYWQRVIGQEHAVEVLKRWAQNPVHAYMFLGPPGTGKRLAAKVFAAQIQANLCDQGPAERQRQFDLTMFDGHSDVLIYEPEGSSLRVDTVKNKIIPAVFRKPIDGPRRILVIDRFHEAGEAAPAALLKTVEEPPAKSIIILLCESVPPVHVAIASRCVQVRFPALTQAEVASWLVKQGVEAAEAASLAQAGGGDLSRIELLRSDASFAERVGLWNDLAVKLDGSGSTAGRFSRDILGAIDQAAEALKTRHANELAELQEREEQYGMRGSGRSQMEDRHKRETRKHRNDELRFGLRLLTQRYGAAITRGAVAGVAGAGGNDATGNDATGNDATGRAAASTGSNGPRGASQNSGAYVQAIALLRDANKALVRNPNISLLLHDLFWHLPALPNSEEPNLHTKR